MAKRYQASPLTPLHLLSISPSHLSVCLSVRPPVVSLFREANPNQPSNQPPCKTSTANSRAEEEKQEERERKNERGKGEKKGKPTPTPRPPRINKPAIWCHSTPLHSTPLHAAPLSLSTPLPILRSSSLCKLFNPCLSITAAVAAVAVVVGVVVARKEEEEEEEEGGEQDHHHR
ncbi:hypothetical protein IWX49DRAFT_566115 [Phyllosticta citricarpa]|uniref:Uncharacterized protein n=1 Tax=Phyllosticta citricarpa TaxID=55181 RepID=A0ABR1MDR1_9PEZI